MTMPWERAIEVTFTKHDAGKLRMDLLEPEFLEGIAQVLTHGAAKYSPGNWQSCDAPFERYYAALQRHLLAYAKGNRFDPDSGYGHLYHAACCLMFLAWFEAKAWAEAVTPNDIYSHDAEYKPTHSTATDNAYIAAADELAREAQEVYGEYQPRMPHVGLRDPEHL